MDLCIHMCAFLGCVQRQHCIPDLSEKGSSSAKKVPSLPLSLLEDSVFPTSPWCSRLQRSIFLQGEVFSVALPVALVVGDLLNWFKCTCNPSTQETEARSSWIQGQPVLYIRSLSPKGKGSGYVYQEHYIFTILRYGLEISSLSWPWVHNSLPLVVGLYFYETRLSVCAKDCLIRIDLLD